MPGAILPGRAAAHDRKPDIRFLRRSHGRRHHADHGIKLVVKAKGTPEDRGVLLKNALPKPIADYSQRRPTDLVFRIGKSAAQFRCQADNLEKISRDKGGADVLRLTTGNSAEIARLASRNGEMLENGIVASPIEVVGKGNRSVRSAAEFIQRHDAAGVWIWQRLQKDRIDDAEDRRICADPERKRQHGDESEARRLAQLAQGVTKIVQHGWCPLLLIENSRRVFIRPAAPPSG
jgi:hypothetical protein